ncbi:hypothetical protein HOY82DRAFT_536648 [Tuber indicum]|nr:hypothetical protein HOY82DRAFT_536648 [Tuber indicum]
MKACPNFSRPAHTSSSKNENATSRIPISSLNPRTPHPRRKCPTGTSGGTSSTGTFTGSNLAKKLIDSTTTLTLQNSKVNWADEVDLIESAEATRTEEERRSRTAEFELRARNMGITEERLIAEKVAIWEGMWAAQQTGNDVQVGIPDFIAPHRA